MDRPENGLDLGEMGAAFDAGLDALQKQLGEDAHDARKINPDVAKRKDEWAIIYGRTPASMYVVLERLVAEGKWEKIQARLPAMAGRSGHYYYPAGCDPFLPTEDCSE